MLPSALPAPSRPCTCPPPCAAAILENVGLIPKKEEAAKADGELAK